MIEWSEEQKQRFREAISHLIRNHVGTRRPQFLRQRPTSSQNNHWRTITDDDMNFVGKIAMSVMQKLGTYDVDGEEWSDLVLAVFQVEVAAVGHWHGYSRDCVKPANRQLDPNVRNMMHSSIKTAAKAHGIKKQKLWRQNSCNSASQFGGPIAFEEEGLQCRRDGSGGCVASTWSTQN